MTTHPLQRSTLLFSLLVIAACTQSAVSADLPRVLILGDSISMGYTPHVKEMLQDEAIVLRASRSGKPENCAGTTNGVQQIDRWLEIEGGNWDVIHVNFGLHDLKHVDAETGKPSNSFADPRQADPEVYDKQLREIVAKLKQTDAKIILATTTPYPAGVSPARDPKDVEVYNKIMRQIAEENELTINDLHGFALPRLEEIQRPKNVHFTPEGSKALAEEVVKAIRQAVK